MVIPPDPCPVPEPSSPGRPAMSPNPKRTLPSLSPHRPVGRPIRRARAPLREAGCRARAARSPGRCRGSTRSTARAGSTSTTGCGTARIRRCWPISRRRTATPTPSCGTPRRCRSCSTRRCAGGSRRPTSRCPSGWTSWLYYTRTEAGAQYPIFCRRLDEADARGGGPARSQPARGRPRLLPDGRVRGQPGPPAARLLGGHQRGRVVHHLREGPDHRRAAGGDDRADLAEPPRGPTTAAPSSTSCWTRPAGPAGSSATVSGPNPVEDVLVHFEPDESFFLDINRTRSRRVSGARPRQPFDQRGALRQRRPAGGAVPGGRAAAARHRVRRRPTTATGSTSSPTTTPPTSAWSRRRWSDPGRANWSRGAPLPARGQAGLGGGVQRPPGDLGAGGRAAADPGARAGDAARSTWSPSPSRSTPCGRTRTRSSTPRCFRFSYTSLVTPELGGRLRPGGAHLDRAEADRGARRLRSVALPERAALRHGARTAPGCRSRWSTGCRSSATAAARCCSRATAPTATASIRRSPPTC